MTAPPPSVKILLVDDEPKNLIALEAILLGEGRDLIRAESGPQALRYILQEDVAVILLDVHMPGMDGFETAALVRSRERTRNTPIIFLTAAIRGDTHVARGYSLGAVDYMLKPFDPDILRSKVAVFVELFRQSREITRQAVQLAETTTFLNSILESATEHAIIALDLDGRFFAWNDGARRIYGYDADEVVGRKVLADLFAPGEGVEDSVRALLDQAHRDGKAEGSFEHRRRSDERFPASLVVDHRRDEEGTPIGYVGIAQDITDRVLADAERARLIQEQAARAQAEAVTQQFAFLTEASRALSASLDSNVTLKALAELVVSSFADACYVHVVDEQTDNARFLTGAHALTLEPVADEQERQYCEEFSSSSIIKDAVRSGRGCLLPSGSAEANGRVGKNKKKNGEPELLVWLQPSSVMVTPLIARERVLGTIVYLAGPGRPAFTSAHLTIAEEVASRAALAVENARLYAETRQAVQLRDEFLASATHDLKTPLTVIKAQTQVLARRFQSMNGPETSRTREMLQRIDVATTRVTQLVDQMLNVAQLQMGQPLQLHRQAIDLVALTRDVTSGFPEAHPSHPVRIESCEPHLVGQWDAGRLERVLNNLLGNAVKYSPDGGEILVEMDREIHDGAAWAVMRVRDTGLGIPADEIPRVFERFYRGRNVAGKIHGTGIGLAGVRQIVGQHGGQISVESVEGAGTTMTVWLPLETAPEPALAG